jgi:hypothetical protein
MAVQLDLEKEAVGQILSNDLGLKKVSTMVLRLLTDEQKQRCVGVCYCLCGHLTNIFLSKIITGNVTRFLAAVS